MAADIATSLKTWSTTASSNQPDSTDAVTALYENLQTIQSVVRNLAAADTISSATTTDLGSKDATFLTVSGTTTITGLGTVSAGIWKAVVFSGILTLTHSGTSLILPGAANITTAAGDCALFLSLGSGNWRCLNYSPASGQALAYATAVVTLTGSQTLTNKTLTTPIIASISNTGTVTLPTATTTLVGRTTTDTLTNKTLTNPIFDGAQYDGVLKNATVTGSYAFSVAYGPLFVLTLTGDTTFSLPAAAEGIRFRVFLVQDATGSRVPTFPASVRWPGGVTPTWTTTASRADWIELECASTSAGTWAGHVLGQNYNLA